MIPPELQQTLSQILATGQIGTPVALRLSLQLPQPHADLTSYGAACLEWAAEVFANEPARIATQQHARGQQQNLLVSFRGGQTVSVSVGRGAIDRERLDCLLIGNHGMARLEGGDCLAEYAPAAATAPSRWIEWITASLESSAPVDCTG